MIKKPKYSICLIARNEEKVLGRCLDSLKEFLDRGGEVCLLDTGSTDKTVEIAKQYGCVVKEVGEKYLVEVKNYMAINQRFVAEGEKSIIKKGDKYFNFAEARNEAAEMASNDFVFFYDADEVSVKMDIDIINDLIEGGMTQAEYNFVFAYDHFGNESLKFVQCKAYNKKLMKWAGRVHELIIPIEGHTPSRVYLNESVYKLGHHQNVETGRHSYLIGLAVDCFEFPKNDRHSHYLARELYWNGRPKSALKEFSRHTKMNGWPAEKAESMMFIGDIYGQFDNQDEQVKMYSDAFRIDSNRNKALIKLAFFYLHHKNYQAALCYGKAAMEMSHTGYYADPVDNYRQIPHDVLYKAYGWLGKIPEAQYHIKKCLEYQPYNPEYLRDTRFYFEYGSSEIEGWMRFPEEQFLYEEAKKHKVIVEVGSWKGRSTSALLKGCKDGTVTAVDTWMGSQDEKDATHDLAKKEDIFVTFKNNLKEFSNLKTIRKTSTEAAKDFEDGSIDFCFIDAGHTYQEVIDDINAWLPKVKSGGVIAGHDYSGDWPEVMKAVNQLFGAPNQVCDSIWVKNVDVQNKKSTLQKFKDNIGRGVNFSFVKRGDGELACMNGEIGGNCDGHPYSQELGQRLKDSYEFLNGKAHIVEFNNQSEYNILLHRTDSNLQEVSAFYKAIKYSPKKKILVAPARLNKIAEILGATQVLTPEVNLFASYSEIYDLIPIEEGAIYLFCAGMPAKLMIADLMKVNPNATYLDCGSAFDMIAYQSRTFQISKEQFLDLYKKDNFSIPQEVHPERLFAVSNIEVDGKVIYDLGCGGHKSTPTAIGMDIRPVTDVQGSIDSLPFENHSADYIISRHSLEHVLDPVKALKEWNRVLKNGGKMVIVLPDHEKINTIDPYYSNGEHLHAYTRETFANLISLFPNLQIIKSGTVLEDWSFGVVIYKLPVVSIIIPQLGRAEGLRQCLDSINNLNYPKELIETIVIDGDETVPQKVAKGLKQGHGEYIAYAANDMTFYKDCLLNAVVASAKHNKALVSFNEGPLLPDNGNICTHFIIKKDFVNSIGGEIFDTSFNHVGVDNLLWAKAEKQSQAIWCENAKISHNHFSKNGKFDEVYEKGWRDVDGDRGKLNSKLSKV